MCGRFTLTPSAYVLMELLGFPVPADVLKFVPRFNIAPTQEVATVRLDAAGAKTFGYMRWGLVPAWAKEMKGPPMIHGRAETLAEKPSFRGALKARRCLVPADGFYEWLQPDEPKGKKRPFRFTMADGKPFMLAGLWETWQGPEVSIDTVALITTPPNDLVATVHDRMPVIVPPEAWDAWLGREATPAEVQAMLTAYPADRMVKTEVGQAVGNVRTDDASCIAPPVAPLSLFGGG